MDNNEIHRYCKFGSSDVDLDNQSDPNIYASDLFLSGPRLHFSISAYWHSQNCELYIPKKRITCELIRK